MATEIRLATTFWPAEAYYQDYLRKHPEQPVCHARVPRFDQPKR